MIIGGSRGLTGAVVLAASSCGRSGAGLVSAAVPDCCLEVVAASDPNVMTVPLWHGVKGMLRASAIDALKIAMQPMNAIGIGPGLGRSIGVRSVVRNVLKTSTVPIVIDADALNALAEDLSFLHAENSPRILTPHIGEFRRLVGEDLTEADCRARAAAFAKQHQVILVLKGPQTIVTDGITSYQNTTGNAGMATGGAGDVLTGIITGLLAQRMPAFDSAVLGVHLHGMAGDIAAEKMGLHSMIASDIRDSIPQAFLTHAGNRS